MRNRRWAVAAGVVLALLAARHPTTTITLQTHDLADPAPRRFNAAIDFGLMGVSVLYTWTAHRLR